MHSDNEYEHIAQWSEHRGVSDYTPRMEWLLVWLGLGITAALGIGMYWVVRAVTWATARGWL